MQKRCSRFLSIIAGMSLLLIFLSQCSLPTMKQIDNTEDYRSLGYPDQRKIARDSQGNLYVAYRKKYKSVNTSTYHIFVAKSTNNGSSWQILNNNQPIEQIGDYMQRVPTIAIDQRDVIHVAWYGQDAQNTGENQRQIKYSRSSDGGLTWSPWVNVGEVQGYDNQKLWQEHPTLAVNGTNVYIAWQGLDPDNPRSSQVRLGHSTDSGATWQPWRTVKATTRGNRSRPSIIAVSGGERLYILAYGGVGTPQQIVWTSSDDGGATWGDWQPVAPNTGDQRHVSAALDSGGRVHAVWRQMDDQNNAAIVYAVLDNGQWSQPKAIQQNGTYQFFPSIAVSGDDSVWVSWTASSDASKSPEDDPTNGNIVVAKKEHDSTWRMLQPPLEQQGANIYSSLRWGEYNNGGNVDLVWLSGSGDSWHLLFSALDSWQ
jgi:hypothetical protein